MARLRATAGALLCAAAAAHGAAAPAEACNEPEESGLLQAKVTPRSHAAELNDTEFTFWSPDPEIMVWDSTHLWQDHTIKAGWLNVPLVYDEVLSTFAKPPRACLRVWGIPATHQPAAQGPLLSRRAREFSGVRFERARIWPARR